jgi:hypothetical protein
MIGTIRNPDDCFDGQPLHIAGTRHVPIRLLPVSSTPLDMPWSQSLHALSEIDQEGTSTRSVAEA